MTHQFPFIAILITLPLLKFTRADPSTKAAYSHDSIARTFNAAFGTSPQPFQINVDPEFIANTKAKLSLTRYTTDLDQRVDGPPRHNISAIRDFWVNEYDWFA